MLPATARTQSVTIGLLEHLGHAPVRGERWRETVEKRLMNLRQQSTAHARI